MNINEFVETINNWLPGQKEKILIDFQKGLATTRTSIRCSGIRDMGFSPDKGQWFHTESIVVDRDGNIIERGPGPEDPIHFQHIDSV